MQQFQVPQFITIEDKVIGPFTIKQFLYLAAGGGLIAVTYYFFTSFIFVPVAIFAGALAGALAFLKINEQPFPLILKNALFYMARPRLFIWKQEARDTRASARPEALAPTEAPISAIPKLSQSKLTDLAWSLDIKERVPR